ncbi:DUF2244 domain-containing protein [Massilia sp. TWP1-3-3]|uniref:DUF2244 domain-containing protein n=1 Tax=Massilia sp. TWP1-3-3 TaxID=2804573 RepID=UPI003CE7101B
MTREWRLKRNCSLSPRQVGKAYGTLAGFVLAIGLAFAARGVWFVFAFGVLELVALAWALLYYASHATDQEHVALTDGCLLIERIEAGEVKQIRLDPYWTKIAVPSRRHTLIALESRGVKVELGAFVSLEEREKVAQELRRELRASSVLVV